MSVIYLIRHAQASFGGENYDRLSDPGIRQAQILGDAFNRMGVEFHAVYSGSMQRQIDTAKIVLSRLARGGTSLEPGIMPEFDEYDSAGIITSQAPEMVRKDPSISEALADITLNLKSFQRVFEGAVLRWISGQHDAPEVETWKEYKERVLSGIEKVMSENGPKKTLAVFASGGTVSVVIQFALGLSDEDAMRLSWEVRNTSVSTFKYSGSRFGLSSFNSAAHLEFQNDPGLVTYR